MSAAIRAPSGIAVHRPLVRMSGGTFAREQDGGVFIARLSLPILG
ncbi:MAG: hypothetical protein P0Y59_10880 [Candidatus Sphingomonas phytovorans]|nr:hypothetical protein [Sphingomonas sp.]WEK02151.1 MAG: hypothetical protein P0Y59_10880 [Sphingomonas sp.]